MFGTQTFNFVFFAVLFACASTVFATVYRLTGDFNETRDNLPNSYMEGVFYYLYDDEDDTKARLRFEYNLPEPNLLTVSNMYHYENNAMYSMCPGTCTAETITEVPDKWWYDSKIYSEESGEGTIRWYKHKDTATPGKTSQVSRILMTQSVTDPTTPNFVIKTIEFTDGRSVEIRNLNVNPDDLPETSGKFSFNSDVTCPEPTCSMFADIVFVLDSSGSVSPDEWDQTIEFVVGVMNSFTFGHDDAAAAVVHFNAPGCGEWPPTYTPEGCTDVHVVSDWNYDDWRCSNYMSKPINTSGVLASGTITVTEPVYDWWGRPTGRTHKVTYDTVSDNREKLISDISHRRVPYGGTCQAFGLELAMKLFDHSPRNTEEYETKPHRIVIAVTDGADYCPSRTRQAVEDLRNDYEALYIPVAVGLECETDRNFLEELSSTLGSEKVFYSVQNYSEIKSVVETIFTPLCDSLHSDCGPDCNSFCACGECFCPTCIGSGSSCEEYTCTTRDGSSNGCELKSSLTCDDDTSCLKHTCELEDGKPKCVEVKVCADLKAGWSESGCRDVTCLNGDCLFEKHDEFCSRFNNGCEKWECANQNEIPTDWESGCILRENLTQQCEEMGKGSCFQYTCNANDWTCDVEDTCSENDTECTKGKCMGDYCVYSPVPNPYTVTECKKYKCLPEEGWVPDPEESVTAATCTAQAAQAGDITCKSFFCDDNAGCQEVVDEKCMGDETCRSIWNTCSDYAASNSSVHYCGTPGCDGGECNNTYVDCSDSEAAERAFVNNTADDFTQCQTIECESGVCVTVPVPRPKDTKCTEYHCVGDKTNGWHWEAFPTKLFENCHSDNCTERYCDDRKGCIPTDICESKSNQCTTFKCVLEYDKETDKNVSSCKEISLLMHKTCMYEECSEGRKVQVKLPVYDYCTEVKSTDKCHYAICNSIGECEYLNYSAPGNDPCVIYECDSEIGWTWRPKCDDGIACTDDRCTVDGRCRHFEVNCYSELNMSGYPCFNAVCKEGSPTYSCTRKLKTGAFMDICGNCINEQGSSASEDAQMECVDAPDQPLNKEGLAAASIALIILGAVIIGAAVATSGVIGTKSLLERARAAHNQSAQNNPLFEGNETEMSNPTFAGEQ